MKPLFFPSQHHLLYGVYHEAVGQPKAAVVLAAPVLHEYMANHSMLRALAHRLSQEGYAVLRFDYAGTGDSQGVLSEVRLSNFVQNICDAVLYVQSLAQVTRVFSVGFRFGASLLHVLPKHICAGCIEVDPIVSGATYLQELADNQRYYAAHVLANVRQEPYTFFGYALSASMYHDIQTFHLPPLQHERVRRIVSDLFKVDEAGTFLLSSTCVRDVIGSLREWCDF